MNQIPEKDWRLLKKIKSDKLNLACERILSEIKHEMEIKGSENHKSYLSIWKIMSNADEEIVASFDNIKRSNAIIKLSLWKRSGLLTDQELSKFTADTRDTITQIVNR